MKVRRNIDGHKLVTELLGVESYRWPEKILATVTFCVGVFGKVGRAWDEI